MPSTLMSKYSGRPLPLWVDHLCTDIDISCLDHLSAHRDSDFRIPYTPDHLETTQKTDAPDNKRCLLISGPVKR